MELMTLAGTFVLGAVTGVAADRILIRSKESKHERFKRIITGVFGEPVYAGTFTLSEARDWIKARKDQLESGSKAVVCKVNNDTLKMLGKELDLNLNTEKYLVIAIVNQNDSEQIRDCLLVRYEKLNSPLEEALSKNNGVLVVEA